MLIKAFAKIATPRVRLRRNGFQFLIATDTVLFYRKCKKSLLKQANDISSRMIPHSSFFDAKWFVEELAQEQQLPGYPDCFIGKR